MDNLRRLFPRLSDPGHIATITVIGLAYAVTIFDYISRLDSPEGPLYPPYQLLIAIALGVVYLWLFLGGIEAFTPIFGKYAVAAVFIAAIGLMLSIEFLMRGRGGIWLIAMPLVATAVTELPPRWRWPVYAAVIAGMALPIYFATGDWLNALFAALTFSPAIVFVIIFVRLTQQAEAAQSKSEALTAELEQANQQLAAYAVQAEEMATVQERNRLAREIHDNLGHYLTVVNVQIKAAHAIMAKDPERAAAALAKAQQLTEEGLKAVRESVSALRESPLGGRSLSDAIGDLARETQASGVVCALEVAGEPRGLDPRVELTLYRAAQEALTNTRKHARASRVDLVLDFSQPDTVRLCVTDNGIGATEVANHDRFGLLGLRERVRQLGGEVQIDTGPGQGFRLQVIAPTSAELPSVVAPVGSEVTAGESV